MIYESERLRQQGELEGKYISAGSVMQFDECELRAKPARAFSGGPSYDKSSLVGLLQFRPWNLNEKRVSTHIVEQVQPYTNTVVCS